ncbi:adducin-related protein C1289.14-like [Penaeus monodon]|uniref:adducin-related protein C1289.14-like n=1 Tax=Penaeus monodon TaxID=6687 RepID=UPI0018A71193|nr:adducin-related protein C1289.14-like [Penaeus monodon]XP_037783001.1 adducin-related protein C1289.14-like [Penaeus monodon]
MMWSRAVVTRVQALSRTFTSSSAKPYTVPEGPWGANRAARLEMAVAYRGLDQLGLNEGVCNHLSVMAPRADGQGEAMMVFPYGLHWSEVTASNLVMVDGDAKMVEGDTEPELAASCIHLGIRKVRPDAKVVMHTHQPYVTALGCLKDPRLLMCHQNCLRFYDRIAYDNEYSGTAIAVEEGKRLGRMLGDKDILFMGHHGVISVASTIAMAFDHLYYLERSAELQILALATQKEIELIPEEHCQPMADVFWRDMPKYADAHFYSMYRRLRKTQPDFEL